MRFESILDSDVRLNEPGDDSSETGRLFLRDGDSSLELGNAEPRTAAAVAKVLNIGEEAADARLALITDRNLDSSEIRGALDLYNRAGEVLEVASPQPVATLEITAPITGTAHKTVREPRPAPTCGIFGLANELATNMARKAADYVTERHLGGTALRVLDSGALVVTQEEFDRANAL